MISVPQRQARYTSPELVIKSFGGIDLSQSPTAISNSRATVMTNMQLSGNGTLERFVGYSEETAHSLISDTKVQHISYSPSLGGLMVISNGELFVNQVFINNGFGLDKVISFNANGIQYFLTGTNYLQYAGGSVTEVIGFIPTTTINIPPDGGGVVFEAANLIQPIRKNSFISDGIKLIYILDAQGIDSAAVTVTVAGVDKTDFTVDRTTGKVTFTTAPVTGNGVDNVIITFSKTISDYANKIKKCTLFTSYGVGNNLHYFFSGNPDFPNIDFQSGMLDPTYFPDLGYMTIGTSQTAIKGYCRQQDYLQIIKEDSDGEPSVWTRYADITTTPISFPVKQSVSKIGLKGDTLQVINNTPCFMSNSGVFRIATSNVYTDRDLQRLSDNIEPLLLAETDRANAISFDFDSKYGICINNNVYVFDYKNSFVGQDGITKYECYIWDNIPASCFYSYNGKLYFGSNVDGKVYSLNTTTSLYIFTHGGIDKPASWESKWFELGRANYKKNITKVSTSATPSDTGVGITITYRTNKGETLTPKLVIALDVGILDFNNIDFNDFDFNISRLPRTKAKSLNVNGIVFFQLVLSSVPGKGMSTTSINVNYNYSGEV